MAIGISFVAENLKFEEHSIFSQLLKIFTFCGSILITLSEY